VIVWRLYNEGTTPPIGYNISQLPLAEVSYTDCAISSKRHSRVICSYQDTRKKFPKQLCDYFIRHLNLIPYDKEIYEAQKIAEAE